MPNFAVIDNEIVVNLIVAESKEIAEDVTKMTCVEYGPETVINIGSKYSDGEFI